MGGGVRGLHQTKIEEITSNTKGQAHSKWSS